jgi:hypothetical protein
MADWEFVGERPYAPAQSTSGGDWELVGERPYTPPPPQTSFPQDPPNTRIGTILPFASDEQGNLKTTPGGWPELYVPEFIRSPARGVMEIGAKLTGDKPIDPASNRLSPDEFSALGLGMVGGAPAARAAARTLDVAGDTAAADIERMRPPPDRTPERAARIVERRVNQDIAAGGTTAQEVVDRINRARELGKPFTLADAPLPNARGLLGSVARKPGPGQTVAKNALEGRDTTAGARMAADLARDLTGGPSAYSTQKALIDARQAEAQPLYDKAYEGGSTAPLKGQFEAALRDVKEVELTATRDMTMAEYARDSGSPDAARMMQEARKKHAEAVAYRQLVETHLQKAQADIDAGTPGAVWNPRIQQFLDDPIFRSGLARGVEKIRLDALARNVPFNASEYALAPDGSVLRVPTMKVLDAGKRGLDAIIESEGRDEFGRLNDRGRDVDQVRRAFLSEIDAVNPDYAAARAAWGGHSASLDAVKFGENLQNFKPEEIADEFAKLGPGDQEFVRIGAADSILERVGRTGFGGDEAKAIIKNEWAKGQLKPIFRTQADFDRFVEAVGIERGMFETKTEILKNSLTAARQAEDAGNGMEASLHAAHGIASTFMGHPLAALRSAMRAYRDLGIRNDHDLNAAIARIMSDLGQVPAVRDGKIVVPRPPAGSPPP